MLPFYGGIHQTILHLRVLKQGDSNLFVESRHEIPTESEIIIGCESGDWVLPIYEKKTGG